MKIKAVLFDLDGTLIESTIDFTKMKHQMRIFLANYGVAFSSLHQNATTQQIIEHARTSMKDQDYSIREIYHVFENVKRIMDEVEMENASKTQPIPGVLNVINQLSLKGIRIAVVTRGCRNYASLTLKSSQLLKLIDLLVARDDVTNPKPHPLHLQYAMNALGVTPRECVMVGDTLMDGLCAKRAEVPFIAVLTGHNREEEFKQNGYTNILNSVSDLPTLIR
jgi:phosphoglycolate phosphatase